jgi:hypothetical protein
MACCPFDFSFDRRVGRDILVRDGAECDGLGLCILGGASASGVQAQETVSSVRMGLVQGVRRRFSAGIWLPCWFSIDFEFRMSKVDLSAIY